MHSVPFVACGILQKEVEYLAEKNNWKFASRYLCSSLHIDFMKLEKALTGSLGRNGREGELVLYGTCHPRMDAFLEETGAVRVKGQNCVEQLLGKELFYEHLEQGAFFLMEDWARRWDYVMVQAFGDNPKVIRDILSTEHKYLLALRTVCSGNFEVEARRISEKTGLPLRWLDVSLDHLEKVLDQGMKEREMKRG